MTADELRACLPPLIQERVDPLGGGDGTLEGEFVLYWMHSAVRGHENPALDAALLAAEALELPALVYQEISEDYPYASDRHHTFMLEGARDVAEELAERGVGYLLHVDRPGHRGEHLQALARRAALVVTEDMPVEPLRTWTLDLSESIEAPVWPVDASAVCPMASVDRPFESMEEFRKEMGPTYSTRVPDTWPEVDWTGEEYRPEDLTFQPVDPLRMDIGTLVARCGIDHSVGPVPGTRGGSRAGYARWQRFVDSGNLAWYHKRRSNPVSGGVSRMSPYLHHGHVSPFRLAREAGKVGGEGGSRYLAHLLVWRDLAYSFCKLRPEHGTLAALPAWARTTLDEHTGDERPDRMDWERLARGDTGDHLWDLAQRSLAAHGELHNNLRMTWGKQLLKWTRDPEEALELAIDLNHRFALDGRDPNSYAGILWCFGLFDEPQDPERPILGTVRARDTEWQATMLDVPGYRRQVLLPPVEAPPRVLVVGAGVAGLTCARILRDHHIPVRVLEKSRGSGGRCATRREEDGERFFDHGAQFFIATDPGFIRHVEAWAAQGVVARWTGRFGEIRGEEVRFKRGRIPRYVGMPGMSAVGRHLSRDLEVGFETQVRELEETELGWVVQREDGEAEHADVVVLAIPSEQVAELLVEIDSPLRVLARSVEMSPTWALVLGFEESLDLPYDSVRVTQGPITWLTRENSKPGRSDEGEVWIVHGTATWSEVHLDDTPEEVTEALTAAFFETTGAEPREPVWTRTHRWRYSRAIAPEPRGALLDDRLGLGVCGDWLLGDNVQAAFLSGQAMAGRILSRIHARAGEVARED